MVPEAVPAQRDEQPDRAVVDVGLQPSDHRNVVRPVAQGEPDERAQPGHHHQDRPPGRDVRGWKGLEDADHQLEGHGQLQEVVDAFLEDPEVSSEEPLRPRENQHVGRRHRGEVGDETPARGGPPASEQAGEDRADQHYGHDTQGTLRRRHAREFLGRSLSPCPGEVWREAGRAAPRSLQSRLGRRNLGAAIPGRRRSLGAAIPQGRRNLGATIGRLVLSAPARAAGEQVRVESRAAHEQHRKGRPQQAFKPHSNPLKRRCAAGIHLDESIHVLYTLDEGDGWERWQGSI